jgi:DNA repair ATPase RecN
MKAIRRILTGVLTLCCILQLQLASAQTAELEQLSLNIEKLMQFKQILSDMKKGYDILNNGYSNIKDISEGTFDLHDAFLKGLLNVNPQIRNYSRITNIIKNQGLILSEYKSAFGRFKNGGRFNPDEITYMGSVYKNLFDRSLTDLNDLTTVLTDSRLRMSDDERLKQIDRLDANMQDKLSFLRSFNKRVSAIDGQRSKEQKDNEQLKQLYKNNN